MRAWVHPSDIADAVYNRINDLLTDKAVSKIKYVVSDWATGTGWINALATNKITAQYITISVEDFDRKLCQSRSSQSCGRWIWANESISAKVLTNSTKKSNHQIIIMAKSK